MIRTRRTSYDMAVQLSEDQFRELMRTAQPQPRNRHFTQCTARFDGTRTQAAVTEFLTAIKIFKSVERIADADALTGLPLLLTGEASTWWNGVKSTITTFQDATQAIQLAFAPQRPNFRVFSEIFACTQTTEMTTDQFVTSQQDRFSQLSEDLPEKWQIDMVYALLRPKIRGRVPRDDVTTFQDLLKKARVIEAAERDHKGLKPAKPAGEPTRARVKCDFCKNFGHAVSECRKKARAQGPKEETAPVLAPARQQILYSATDAALQGSSAETAHDARRPRYPSVSATRTLSQWNDQPWKSPSTGYEAPPTSTAEQKPPSLARSFTGS